MSTTVEVPSIRTPIMPAPGFEKKLLATHKLDLMGRCGFHCTYCSSTEGNYQRINRGRFADAALVQLGRRVAPVAMRDDRGVITAEAEPELVYTWPDVLERLEAQIDSRRNVYWGKGSTLVFSMLTDAFSPQPLKAGVTEKALSLLFKLTDFRVRVLTKNSTVGLSREWLQWFARMPDRAVVGLSTGTLDDAWAARVEVGCPPPSARVRATRALQDAGAATFGMLCPVFPDALHEDGLDRLVDAIRPERCEHVWAEPFNDRANWRAVRAGYVEGSPGWRFLTDVYERGMRERWSGYATELYQRLITKARAEGWAHKLRYLLYEGDIHPDHAPAFKRMEGVLLQSKPAPDNPHLRAKDQTSTGWSANPAIRELQRYEGEGYVGWEKQRLAWLKSTPDDQLTAAESAELGRIVEAELLAERDANRARCAAEGHPPERNVVEGDTYCIRCGLLLDEDGNGPESIPDQVMAARSGGML